ncbi:MAG: type IX secretion system outer membrane channel protein PorV [Saprospiraceae bacterium]
MKKLLLLFTFAGCLLAANSATAQCIFDDNTGEYILPDGTPCPNTIVSAVPFLRIVADARSGAMGDVGIALSPDANAMQFNASKLAFAEENVGLSATYTPWLRALGLQDVYLAYLSGYTKIDELQAVGLSLRYFSLGSIAFTDPNGEPIGTGRPNEFEVKGSYARQLTENFSAAIGAKFIYSNLAAGQIVEGEEIEPGIAGAADFSLTYMNDDLAVGANDSELTLGLAISNIGSKITYTNSINRDFIPANLGFGAAWKLKFDEYNTLTIAADVNKLLVPTPQRQFIEGTMDENPDYDADSDGIPDWKQQSPIGGALSSFGDAPLGFREEMREFTLSTGLEYWYDEQFAVRAGYYTEHQTKGNRKFFTVGLGLKYNVFGLNFSYLVPTTNQRNPLDNTLRFSLLFDFGALDAIE